MTKAPVRVLFLDDNEDLRALVPMFLRDALGVECLCFGAMMELKKSMDDVLHAQLAILDINLGPNLPDGVDAYNWLKDQGFQGKIVFFTGHARANPQVARAEKEGAQILEKPVMPDELISCVRNALGGLLC